MNFIGLRLLWPIFPFPQWWILLPRKFQVFLKVPRHVFFFFFTELSLPSFSHHPDTSSRRMPLPVELLSSPQVVTILVGQPRQLAAFVGICFTAFPPLTSIFTYSPLVVFWSFSDPLTHSRSFRSCASGSRHSYFSSRRVPWAGHADVASSPAFFPVTPFISFPFPSPSTKHGAPVKKPPSFASRILGEILSVGERVKPITSP